MGAAQALGMNYSQMMRLIILPQAFRKMTPLLLQQSIILFQDTSTVYTVGLVDFLNASRSSGDIIGRANEFWSLPVWCISRSVSPPRCW